MLPKNNRLKKKNDFDSVFKAGFTCKEKYLTIRAARNNILQSRFGFIVSKKISKKAVVRNKIKRLLSKAVEKNIKEIKKGFDIIIIVSNVSAIEDFFEAEKIIMAFLKKNHLIN